MEGDEVGHRPMRYLPVRRLYSPSINPSAGMPKRKLSKTRSDLVLLLHDDRRQEEDESKTPSYKPNAGGAAKPILVYQRRKLKRASDNTSFSGSVSYRMKKSCGFDQEKEENLVVGGKDAKKRKRKRSDMDGEVPGLDASVRKSTRLIVNGECDRVNYSEARSSGRRAREEASAGRADVKRWLELSFEGVDPHAFVGLACKVFWPMDDDWYKGLVTGYNSANKQHHVKYNDGDVEHLILQAENVKFHISSEEMQHLNLKCGLPRTEKNGLNYDEMLALAASFDYQDLEPGDIVWAKLTGHAMWPAVIVKESSFGGSSRLKPARTDQSVTVQFFGTHDFARINLKQAIPFLNGLLSSLHLKCKQARFYRSLDEAKMYLSNQQLPKSMLRLQKGSHPETRLSSSGEGEERTDSSEDFSEHETMEKRAECTKATPIDLGDLCVTNLGNIVCNSKYFHGKKYIWPEGYTAFRKFVSIKDQSLITSYKMEVLRNPKVKARPLFRVTLEDGDQIDEANPNACWEQIYSKIRNNRCNGLHNDGGGCDLQKSGSYMFGFTNARVSQLIQDLPNSKLCSKYFGSYYDQPEGYRAVHVDWKDLDRCSVCHMDEEYEDDLFLQCEKCRMMVHAQCYGEIEPLDGLLWLCNLCQQGASKTPPPCCLCPVKGGVMKPTTDGRWAHLACAMWIPETCLLDVKRMEPIDGISKIHKDRWKLLCSICGVFYGACIQCSNRTCRVAYHPLCARAAGLCVELEGEDNLHLSTLDDDDDQCIRLLSFCKKHRQPSKHPAYGERHIVSAQDGSDPIPLSNPSGCARTESYDWRIVRKKPQIVSASSVKRLFVENTPYLIGGYYQNGGVCGSSSNDSVGGTHLSSASRLRNPECEFFETMAEKYKNMKETFRKRLTFGKSKIHGFGIFAKAAHKAGDMVIEYSGELVRSPIADLREHTLYNALVGAGTYMFRIDDERVIDATKAGSIAHLINHSCEPNCFSRMITVSDGEHIIIFAKRDISQWEELTYDYRYFSTDKKLSCNCGFPRCRGVVNDTESEEQMAKLRVPLIDLVPWRGT